MAPAPPVSCSTVHVSVSYVLRCRGYRRREIESVIEEVSEGRDSCRGDVEQERPFFYHPPTLYFLPCLPPCSDLLPPCRPPPSTNLKLELNAPSSPLRPLSHKSGTRSPPPVPHRALHSSSFAFTPRCLLGQHIVSFGFIESHQLSISPVSFAPPSIHKHCYPFIFPTGKKKEIHILSCLLSAASPASDINSGYRRTRSH